MEDISLWSTKDTNNYLYKQLKAVLESHGFVVSKTRTKHLVRIREHHIQIICPVVIYGITDIEMHVVPTVSYSDYSYCRGRISLKKSNDPKEYHNYYSGLAIRDERTGKASYQSEEIQRAWIEAMLPQIEEMITYFDTFKFAEFVYLSKNGLNGTLSYSGCLVNDDALRFLTIAYNAIWMGDCDSSLPLLKRAVLGYEEGEKNCITYNREIDLKQRLNKAAAEEIIEIMESQQEGWKDIILDRLSLLEKDAAEKVWGVTLDEHGNTKWLSGRNLRL